MSKEKFEMVTQSSISGSFDSINGEISRQNDKVKDSLKNWMIQSKIHGIDRFVLVSSRPFKEIWFFFYRRK